MDNFKTHTASAFYETSEPAEAKRIWDRIEFVYTPKHGSWLNMAEIELHALNGQCLNRHISTIEKIKKRLRPGRRIEIIRTVRLIGSLLLRRRR